MAPTRRQKPTLRFARGFKKPNKETIHKALKLTSTMKKQNPANESLLVKLIDHFKPLPQPTDTLDWLAQFNEHGQTCNEFLNDSPYSVRTCLGSEKFIYYVQIGHFNNKLIKFDDLIDYSKRFFYNEAAIKLYPEVVDIEIEQHANKTISITAKVPSKGIESKLSIRYDAKTQHHQIITNSLLKLLSKIKPQDASSMIGLTGHDLYVEDSDLFVAGLCNGLTRVGVFSYFRYDPNIKFSEEHWFDIKRLKKQNTNKSLLLTRCCKLMAHETCHLLGIAHCTLMDCCMNGSGHLEEDFRQSMFLCPVDLKKLTLIFDPVFDIKKRYERLKEFFDKHNAVDESKQVSVLISALA